MSKECDTSRMTSAEVEAMRAISRAKHAGTYVQCSQGLVDLLRPIAQAEVVAAKPKKKKAPVKPVKAVKHTKPAPKVKPKAKKRG